MLFSESLPQNILHVWDVEDKTNPVEIATLAGAGGPHRIVHPQVQVGLYGSEGYHRGPPQPGEAQEAQGELAPAHRASGWSPRCG